MKAITKGLNLSSNPTGMLSCFFFHAAITSHWNKFHTYTKVIDLQRRKFLFSHHIYQKLFGKRPACLCGFCAIRKFLFVCLFCFVFFFFAFCFLGLYLWQMEVPRLGVQLELQLLAYATATARPDWSWISSVTYTTAQGNAGSLTHWARPGIKPETSWFPVGLISTVPQRDSRKFIFNISDQ